MSDFLTPAASAAMEYYSALIVLLMTLCWGRYTVSAGRKVSGMQRIMLLQFLILVVDAHSIVRLPDRFSLWTICYGLTMVQVGCFHRYLVEELRRKVPISIHLEWPSYLGLFALFAFWASNPLHGLVLNTGRDLFTPGPLYLVSQIGIAAAMLPGGLILLRYWKQLPWRRAVSLISFWLIPVLVIILKPVFKTEISYLVSTVIIILIFMESYIEENLENQRISDDLAESRNLLLLSQIQPHFIFNTLTSIWASCKDPETADLILAFSRYLRMNLDTISDDSSIPFERELDHVKAYLTIQKFRFGERLRVEYRLETTDFALPPLTIQPLVENALIHGLGPKPEGGTLCIRTQNGPEGITIVVEDNGVGFDPSTTRRDGRTHVALQNVRERLARRVGGTLTVNSTPGRGTRAEVKIPLKAIR